MSLKSYNVHIISFILAISGLLIGLESSSLNTFVHSTVFSDYYGPITSWEKGWMGSSGSLGAILGALASGLLGDKTGFLIMLQLAVVFSTVGTLLALSLPSVGILCAARIIKGITYGLLATSVPTYIADTIPKSSQGYSLSIFHISSTFGAILMYYGGYGLLVCLGSMLSFKIAWAAELIPAVALFCLNFVLPESPKHLGLQKRWHEATVTIDRIHRKLKGTSVDNEEYVILLYTAGTSIKSLPFVTLFSRRHYKHTVVGILVQILLQCSMVGVLGTYIVYVCEASSLDVLMRGILGGSLYVFWGLFTFMPLLLLDRTRRKDAMVFGYILLTLAYAAIFAINHWALEVTEIANIFNWSLQGIHASTALALFAFILSVYSGCLVSVSWLYTSEIFPATMRAKGYSMAMIISSLASAIINVIFPTLVGLTLYWLFLGLAIVCAISVVILAQLPETKQLSNSDVELLFQSAIPDSETLGYIEKKHIQLAAKTSLSESSSNRTDLVPNGNQFITPVPSQAPIVLPASERIISGETGGETSSFLSTDWIQSRHLSSTSANQQAISTLLLKSRFIPASYTGYEADSAATILLHRGILPTTEPVAPRQTRTNPFSNVVV